MESKKLTKEEKEKIEKMAKYLLSPIDGKVEISDHYSTIHCSVSSGGAYNHVEWDEYWYRIKVKTIKGDHEFGKKFKESTDLFYLAQVAWGIAHNVWGKLDENIYSPLAENLWPSSNNHLPNYEALLKV